MNSIGFLVSVTTDTGTSELKLIKRIMPYGGHSLLGGGGSEREVSRTLYIIPAGGRTADEWSADLGAVPGVRQIAILPVSDPVKPSELSDVRKLYLEYDFDASRVSDKDLSLYLKTHLNGAYTYCLISGGERNEQGKSYLRFRLTQDILDEHRNDPPGEIISETKRMEDGEEIHEVVMVFKESKGIPPPPPPPLANKITKMTDAEIKQWYLLNDRRKLKAEDIEIERTTDEIIIRIQHSSGSETLRYSIPNDKNN